MVQLTEVEDEHFQHTKSMDFDEDDFTDTGSSLRPKHALAVQSPFLTAVLDNP